MCYNIQNGHKSVFVSYFVEFYNKILMKYNFMGVYIVSRGMLLRLCDTLIWVFSIAISAVLIVRGRVVDFYDIYYAAIITVCLHLIVTEAVGLYKCIWRYLNKYSISKGLVCYGITTVLSLSLLYIFNLQAKTLIIISGSVAIVVWIISRLVYVVAREYLRINHQARSATGDVEKKRTLIIGGGEATKLLLDEMEHSTTNIYEPVCIVDDDNSKIGRYIGRVKIVGTINEIRDICKKYDIKLIIFAIYNITDIKRQNILNICAELNLPVKMLPHYADFVNSGGKNIIAKVRDINISDLLGRKKTHIDIPMLNDFLENKTVLVTGGGGSIGGELCRQIATYNPKCLIIADVYENGAYAVQQSILRNGFKNLYVEILSITDRQLLETLFAKYRPEIVYHAAAHKHVPLMENSRIEAVKNNIFGTKNVVEFADKYNVKKFIMVSTDKAVNPTNIMGATKRACELIVKSQNEVSNTNYVAVRFGNVLGSNGSVIPLFKEQIKKGGPVTVTDPNCVRYFMTISEAVELLLTAGSMANGGETFVLDMGSPVKIDDLAKKMISLSGFVPNVDIKIKYIGMRPGEKMYEELLVDTNLVSKTCSEKIFVDKPEHIDRILLHKKLDSLEKETLAGNVDGLMISLKDLVPTYTETL